MYQQTPITRNRKPVTRCACCNRVIKSDAKTIAGLPVGSECYTRYAGLEAVFQLIQKNTFDNTQLDYLRKFLARNGLKIATTRAADRRTETIDIPTFRVKIAGLIRARA